MKDEGRIKNRKLRSLRSLQDGNENRGQLFALTRVLPNARPSGLPVYVAPLPAGSIQRVCHDTLDFIQVPGFPSAIRVFALTHSRRNVVQR